MRLLLVTFYYTPDLTPRAFRWSSIAEYLIAQGHRVDVICAWKPGLSRTECVNGVCIYRVGGISTIYGRSIPKIHGARPNNSARANHRYPFSAFRYLAQKLNDLIKLVYKFTWKPIYWPDYACLWYFPARIKAKSLLNVNKYDGLITVSHPFTAHLAGLASKRLFAALPWVVDIGDPFCFSEIPLNHKRYQRLNYAVEKRVLNCADVIAVTTQPALDKYVALFREVKHKIRVIPPLAFQTEINSPGTSFFPQDDKIRLVFAGTLYRNLRNPGFVLRVFSKLLDTNIAAQLELHFLGNIHDCWKWFDESGQLMGTKLFIHGLVSRDRVFQALKEADILINIGNNSPYQLPSKVLEYASTGNPILNFIKLPNDSSMPFFNTYPAALSLLEQEEVLWGEQWIKLVQFIQHPPNRIDKETLDHLLAPYRIESIGKAYLNLFTGV